jgi:hypothetical protein
VCIYIYIYADMFSENNADTTCAERAQDKM